jgi:hypothetical protein
MMAKTPCMVKKAVTGLKGATDALTASSMALPVTKTLHESLEER